MTTRTSSGPGLEETRTRARRWKALLASGVILGLGAATTVAHWTDTEFVTAEFAAGVFVIELNVDGTWGDSRSMSFDADAMYPGAVAHAPVLVRTSADTSADGEIAVHGQGYTGGAIGGALDYRAVSFAPGTPAPACDATAFTSTAATFVFGGPSAWVPMSPHSPDTVQTVAADADVVTAYCFEVRLPGSAPSAVQGTTAEHTWTFDAVSTTETP